MRVYPKASRGLAPSACYNDFAMPKIYLSNRFKPAIAAGVLWSGALLISGCGLTPSELKKIRPPSLPQPKVPVLKAGALPTITVIPGGSESYWNEARRGSEAAGKKFGARIVWKVPSGDLIPSQKKLVENVSKTSHGLVLAPTDSTKLMQPVGDAARAGVAVVTFDRDIFTNQNKLSFVHNDDEASGVLAAKQVGNSTAGSGSAVAMQSHSKPDAEVRRNSFEQSLKTSFPKVELFQPGNFAGANPIAFEPGGIPAREILSSVQFTPPTGTKPFHIVFGADEVLRQAVQRGEILALISPDYYQMAFQSVKAIMDFRATKQMPPREIKIAPRVLTKNSATTTIGSTP